MIKLETLILSLVTGVLAVTVGILINFGPQGKAIKTSGDIKEILQAKNGKHSRMLVLKVENSQIELYEMMAFARLK